MIRKLLIAAMVLVFIGLLGVGIVLPPIVDARLNKVRSHSFRPSQRAQNLHKTLCAVDLHADSLLWKRDLLVRNKTGCVDVPRLIEGNVGVQAFTIVTKVPHGVNIERNNSDSDLISLLCVGEFWPIPAWFSLRERATYQADRLQQMAAASDGKLTVIKSAKDLEAYMQRRKSDPHCTAGFLGIEGAHALDGNLDNIDVLYDHGVRMMAPTHFFDNDIGGSAHGLAKKGLTEKGKEMIRRMQAKSMIVDLAHASPAVIRDALAISKKPMIVSHTGVKGTCNNTRNLSDAQIQAIAATGGLIGIGYWSQAVCGTDASAIARAIRYTANKVGVEHVCLGSDFDGATTSPFDASELVILTDALLKQGFSDDEIRLIMGGNALRLLKAELPRE